MECSILYHLSKTRPSSACFIKKECDKLVKDKSGSSSQSGDNTLSGNLLHITDDEIVEDIPDESFVDLFDSPSNDGNDDVLAYFARMSHHYLHLAKASLSTDGSGRHPMQYPIIADSGANYHMFKEKEFFGDIRPTKGSVLLGDGKTSINIKGVGTLQCMIDGHQTTLPNHGLETTPDQGLFIKIPGFQTKAIIGSTDIYLNALPCSVPSSSTTSLQPALTSRDDTQHDSITSFQSSIQQETKKLDSVLYNLCQYYATAKTKRQLDLERPEGFCHLTATQRSFANKLPPRKTSNGESFSPFLPLQSFSSIPSSNTKTL
jgi:hypothetical protein